MVDTEGSSRLIRDCFAGRKHISYICIEVGVKTSWVMHGFKRLDLYIDEDLDEMIAAQEKFLDAVGFENGTSSEGCG